MVKSVNSVYAQEGVDAGLAHVRETAVRLGIPDNVRGMDPANTSMTLGTATPSALNLAGAYAGFANHGQAFTPWSVVKLERVHTGGAIDVPKMPDHVATTALDRGTADAVTDVLRDVVTPRGTGAAALELGRPAAGKTGTTDSNLSAWFAGFTPELATTVGLFREHPKTHAKEPLSGTAGYTRVNGGTFPTQIWTAYMSEALDGTDVQDFDLEPSRGNNRAETPTATTPPSPTTTPTTTATATATATAPAPSAPAPTQAAPTAPRPEPSSRPAEPQQPTTAPTAPSFTPAPEQPTAPPQPPTPTGRPTSTRPTAPPTATTPPQPTGAATPPPAR
ncbi:penicillin-binding transpeptidase domain-containing protein [Kitasatospora aburaviensis]